MPSCPGVPSNHRAAWGWGRGGCPLQLARRLTCEIEYEGLGDFMGGFSVSNKFQGVILQSLIPGRRDPTPNQQKGRRAGNSTEGGVTGPQGVAGEEQAEEGERGGAALGVRPEPFRGESCQVTPASVSLDHHGPLRPPPRPWTRSTSKGNRRGHGTRDFRSPGAACSALAGAGSLAAGTRKHAWRCARWHQVGDGTGQADTGTERR